MPGPGEGWPPTGLPTRPEIAVEMPPMDYALVPSVDEIGERTRLAIERYENASRAALAKSKEELAELARLVNVSTDLATPLCDGVPCDYHPPGLAESEEEVARHMNRSSRFELDMSASLDAFDEARKAARNLSNGEVGIAFNGSISASDVLDRAPSSSWFSHKYLDDQGKQLQWLLDSLLAFSAVFQAFDVFWRLLQTVRIFKKFYGRSNLMVEPIDITGEADDDKKGKGKQALAPMQQLAVLLTHPMFLSAVLVGFGTFLTINAGMLYKQAAFDPYFWNCTRKDPETLRPVGDGTLLTRNAYAMAYNFASREGESACSAALITPNPQPQTWP